MKKIIAMLLSVILLLPMLGSGAFAAQGTEYRIIYDINFENGTVGSMPPKGSTNWVVSAAHENVENKTFVRIAELDGNKVMHLYRTADSPASAGIRAQCALNLTDYETMQASVKIKSTGANANVVIYSDGGTTTLFTSAVEDWVTVEMQFDFKTKTCTVTSGETTKNVTFKLGTPSTAQLRFTATNLLPGTGAYFDDIRIGTYDSHVYIRQSPVAGNQEVYWQYALPENAISAASYVSNAVAHPRVLVTDWDAIRAKIAASEEAKIWYANIKAAADAALSSDPQKYVDDNGHLKLYAARNARDRLQALAFVYNIENDARYFEKAYEEMLYYGAYKNWSGFGQTLVCAEILFGFACAYDWLYDELAKIEATGEIIEIMKTQALGAYVYHYEGMMDWSFSTITINWNPVCNASLMMAAMAIADEEPEISEYFMEKALPSITKALAPYAPEGAYPEGVSYWDYGTSYLIFANHLLETAFVDGFEIPESYQLWKAPGIAETCDFGIYMNGPTGRFDYGDCVTGYTSCEVMYWAAERFDKPHYAWWQNNIQKETGSYLSGYPAMMSLVWYNPENAETQTGDFTLDKFYADETSKFNGFSARSSWDSDTALFTAMQGGINKGSHLHQSLGTYVIDYQGKRFIKQAGGADYDLANEESSNVIYGHRAESNNCLAINPTAAYDQKYGGYAALIAQGSKADVAYGVLDMTDVYSTLTNTEGEALVPSAKRGLKLTDGRNRVIVQDEVTLNGAAELYWFAHTAAAVNIAEDGQSAVLDMDGVKMLARIVEAPSGAAFELMDNTSVVEEGVINNVTGGYKLAIHMENQTEAFTLAVEYVPLTDAENIPAVSAVTALDAWGESKTVTTRVTEGDKVTFTTQLIDAPKRGYVAVVLYDDSGAQVGMKLAACGGTDTVVSTFEGISFANAKVMLIESFFTMRILTAPETVNNL